MRDPVELEPEELRHAGEHHDVRRRRASGTPGRRAAASPRGTSAIRSAASGALGAAVVAPVHRADRAPRAPRSATSGRPSARATAGTVTSSCVGPDPARGEDPVGPAARAVHRLDDVVDPVGDGVDGERAGRRARAGAAPPTARSRPAPSRRGPRSRRRRGRRWASASALLVTAAPRRRTALGGVAAQRSARHRVPHRVGDVLDRRLAVELDDPLPARRGAARCAALVAPRDPRAGRRRPRRSRGRPRRPAGGAAPPRGRTRRKSVRSGGRRAAVHAPRPRRCRRWRAPGRRGDESVNRSETTSTPPASLGAISHGAVVEPIGREEQRERAGVEARPPPARRRRAA